MKRSSIIAAVLAAGLGLAPPESLGQDAVPLRVGDSAPDFTIPGASRDGILETPIRLSDYQGRTVVIAFFFRARTPG